VSRTDRFGRILELLARDGSVSVGALAADLAVSEATVRRDLQILGDQRLLERSHGGAIAHGTAHELPVRYRTQQREQKRQERAAAVARYLASHKVPLRNITMLGTGVAEGEQRTREERAQGRKVDVRVFVPEI